MYLLGTGRQRAARLSRVLVGAQPLTWASWEAVMSAEDLPTGNFESYNVAAGESFDEGLHAFLKCALRGGGDWDAGTNFLGNPPGLYMRDDLPNLQFLPSRLDNVPWLFPFARVRSSTNGAQVHDKVTFQFAGNNQGSFSWPTGSVANN